MAIATTLGAGALAAAFLPQILDEWFSLFGGGSEGRQEKLAKKASGLEFLTNRLLVEDDKKAREEGRRDNLRAQMLAAMERSADRESMTNLAGTQMALGRMGGAEDFTRALQSAALAMGMPGISPMQLDAMPDTGDPFSDYGLI